MKDWKPLLLSLMLSAVPYLIWDVYFTEKGYWGFNSRYLSGYYLINLPVEEVLFFFCIPFACVFTHISILKIKQFKLNEGLTTILSTLILIIVGALLLFNLQQAYTTWVMLFVLVIHGFSMLYFKNILSHYLVTFIFMLIPFVLVNGVLTGFGIEDQVVWYNDIQNFGMRFITIPIEDFFYAYSMILLNLIIFKSCSKNKSLEYFENTEIINKRI